MGPKGCCPIAVVFPLVVGLLTGATTLLAQDDAKGRDELVANPTFAAGGDQGMPKGWTQFVPAVAEAKCRVQAVAGGMQVPDQDGRVEGENVFRVRARDNGIYLVPSVYDGNSLVIDPMGRIVASSGGRDGVAWAEVDLSRREPLPWVGDWRQIGPRDRMPPTYRSLSEEPQPSGR